MRQTLSRPLEVASRYVGETAVGCSLSREGRRGGPPRTARAVVMRFLYCDTSVTLSTHSAVASFAATHRIDLDKGARVGLLSDVCVAALEPYIGRVVADTVVRATALSLGKPMEDLDLADLPALTKNIRRVLEPVAARATVDDIVRDIEVRVE